MKYLKYIPILQIYLSVLSIFVPFYFDSGNTVGYSMAACLAYWYGFQNESRFIKDCIIGLFAMNLVSLCKNWTNYNDYAMIYDLSIFVLAHIRLIRYARKN